MDIELRHIRCFLAVADQLSFSRAAEQLQVSQSSLTRAVAAMEQSMGMQLLLRSTRRVNLTPEGKRVKAELEKCLWNLDNVISPGSKSAALRLGFNWVLPDLWTQKAISIFERETKTQVRLVRSDQPHAGLISGETDIAIKRGPARMSRMRTVTLFHEPRVAAVYSGSLLARRSCIRWEELVAYPLVLNTVSGTAELRQWQAGRQPSIAARCDNFDEWLETVALGRGVGITTVAVARRVAHPAVQFLRIEGAPLVPVYLAYPRQDAHPLVEKYVQAAQQATAALQAASRPEGGKKRPGRYDDCPRPAATSGGMPAIRSSTASR
jgi:DNA-binding transcriptional LysR family regulator